MTYEETTTHGKTSDERVRHFTHEVSQGAERVTGSSVGSKLYNWSQFGSDRAGSPVCDGAHTNGTFLNRMGRQCRFCDRRRYQKIRIFFRISITTPESWSKLQLAREAEATRASFLPGAVFSIGARDAPSACGHHRSAGFQSRHRSMRRSSPFRSEMRESARLRGSERAHVDSAVRPTPLGADLRWLA